MQSLDERFGDKKVTGGNLDGTEFRKLTGEQLKRAARRYPSDDALRKYAKAKLTIVELEGNDDPLPCAPLRPNQVVCAKDATVINHRHKFFLAAKSIIWELLVHPFWEICVSPCFVDRTSKAFDNACDHKMPGKIGAPDLAGSLSFLHAVVGRFG